MGIKAASLFAERMKRLREPRGLTQADVARRCRLTPGQVSQIEDGTIKAQRLDTILEIAKGLGVPPAALLDERFEEPIELYRHGRPLEILAETERKARRPEVWRVGADGFAVIGLLKGDLAVVDIGRLPEPGEIVVCTLAGPDGTASTLLRRWLPHWLAPPGHGEALDERKQDVRTIGPVAAKYGGLR